MVTMRNLATSKIAAILTIAVFSVSPATAEGKFQKLTGAQISAKVTGMEISDEVHWTEFLASNGILTSYSISRKSSGKWRVEKDELCFDRANKDDSGCFQVWLSGNKIELRRKESGYVLEGVLRRPVAHN